MPRPKAETPWDRVTVRLSPENHAWLRRRAFEQGTSQALVLNEALDGAREQERELREEARGKR
jgi:hypothetical protein